MNTLLAKNQFTKIFVSGNQQRVLLVGLPKNYFIRNAGVKFRNVENFVTILSKLLNDLAIHTLVGYQPHAALPGAGYRTSARSASAAKLRAAKTPARVRPG
jgi:hypothetical protein